MRGSDLNTWTLDNFGAGEDLREVVFAQDQNRFKEMINVRTTSARRIVRRPPAIMANGTWGVGCRGLVLIGSSLKTIRKKGDTDYFPVGVSVLEFDNPDHCTTWELIQATVFNGHAVALIRHAYPGGTVTSRIFLHVFDGSTTKPTYVEDPFCPTSWYPTLPLHVYRTGTPGSFMDYSPKMHVAKGRVYISRPDGNVGFCKVANARAWNTRTYDELTDHGEWYYFITTDVAGVQDFIVSEDFSNLDKEDKWAYYVLERMSTDGTGRWLKVYSELFGAPTVLDEFRVSGVTSRFGGPDEIKISAFRDAGTAGEILRFRLGIKSQAAISGHVETPGYTEYFNGTGAQLVFQCLSILELQAYGVYVGGVLKVLGVDYTASGLAGKLKITFIVAPPVGVGNVSMSAAPYVLWSDGATAVYEGISYTNNTQLNAGASMLPTAGAYLRYIANLSLMSVPDTRIYQVTGGILSPSFGLDRYNGTWFYRADNGFGNPLTFSAQGAYDGGQPNGDFYITKVLDYQLNQAGADDAGYLPTAASAVSGGLVTMLCGIKDRLFVAYRDGSELWEVATDPALASRIDTSPLGTGPQTSPIGVLFEGILMVPLASGLWGVSLGNDLSDRMNSNRLGDPIQRAGVPLLQDATYWPWLGCYVAAQTTSGVFGFRVFDYNRETKVAAWSRWTALAAPTAVDPGHMVALGDRLYFRVADKLWYFDASVYDSATPSFRDTNDVAGAGNAYRSRLVWHKNDFKRPGAAKRFLYVDIAQQGTCRTAFRTVAYDDNQELDGPTISGTTYGKERYALSMTAQAIAPILESTDETGWELERLALDFRHMRR